MLGIDIGNYSIKVSLIKGSAKKPRLESWSYDVLPLNFRDGNIDAGSLRKIVSQLVKKIGRNEKAIAVSIPSSEAIFRTLSLGGNLKDDLLEGEVQLELVNFIPFPLSQTSFDYQVLGESSDDSGNQDVFIVASKQSLVNKALSSIESKSIKAKKKIVDVDVFALSKMVELNRSSEDKMIAVLDVGYHTSRLAIFDDHKLVFTREINIGGHNLTELIAEVHEISIDDAEVLKKTNLSQVSSSIVSGYIDSIGEQVILSLDAYQSNQATYLGELNKMLVTGGGTCLPGFVDILEENIGDMTLVMMGVSDGLGLSAKSEEEFSGYANCALTVSAGLGIRRA